MVEDAIVGLGIVDAAAVGVGIFAFAVGDVVADLTAVEDTFVGAAAGIGGIADEAAIGQVGAGRAAAAARPVAAQCAVAGGSSVQAPSMEAGGIVIHDALANHGGSEGGIDAAAHAAGFIPGIIVAGRSQGGAAGDAEADQPGLGMGEIDAADGLRAAAALFGGGVGIARADEGGEFGATGGADSEGLVDDDAVPLAVAEGAALVIAAGLDADDIAIGRGVDGLLDGVGRRGESGVGGPRPGTVGIHVQGTGGGQSGSQEPPCQTPTQTPLPGAGQNGTNPCIHCYLRIPCAMPP